MSTPSTSAGRIVVVKSQKSEISISKNVLSGMPVLAGTRIPVDILVARWLRGATIEQIALDYEISHIRLENLIREKVTQDIESVHSLLVRVRVGMKSKSRGDAT